MTYPALSLLIGDQETVSGSRGTIDLLNPATGDVLARIPKAGSRECLAAIEAAKAGFETWSGMSAFDRSAIMRRAAERIRAAEDEGSLIMTLEQGKPRAQARIEWLSSADLLEWFAEEGRRVYGRLVPSRDPSIQLAVHKRPIGPVAAFSPWNFPAWAPMQKIAPALGAGCSVILKPSSETPGTAWKLAMCLKEAGLPAGVLSVIWGSSAEISDTIMADNDVRKISLTGSVPVGRGLAADAGRALKKATMELGGHGPVIIAEDADIERAANLAATWKFRNAGQVCVSPTRFMVAEKVYDQFAELFASETRKLVVGDGMDDQTTMGPLINASRVDTIAALVEDALEKGADCLAGGHRINKPGFYFAPTVLGRVNADMAAMNDEPFGPLALLQPVPDLDAAIREANRLPFGLAAYCFTRDTATSHRVSQEIEAGMLAINHFAVALPETPFGGVKDSGFGSEGGIEGIEAYLNTMLVSSQHV